MTNLITSGKAKKDNTPRIRRANAKAWLTLAVLPVVALSARYAPAASLTWNSSGSGVPVDGSGNWDTTATNWYNGTTDVAWDNASTAVFGSGGTAGTVTIDDLSGTVSAAGLTFNPIAAGSNYTIAASGADTLTLTAATITVTTGLNPTINAPIAGTVGLNLTGNGTLTLGGPNTYTGNTVLSTGCLVLAPGGTFGATTNRLFLGNTTGGETTAETLDLTNASATIGGLTVNGNTTTPNTVKIGATQTLTLAGAGTFGWTPTTSCTTVPNDVTDFIGGGSLIENAGNFSVGTAGNGVVSNNVVDLSGLSNFTYTNTSGCLSVASGNQDGATLTFASTSNTVTAANILFGGGSTSNGGSANVKFGPGTNSLFYSGTLSIAIDKSPANVTFASSTGTLLIRNTDGVSRAGNITIGSRGQSGSVNPAGNVTLIGHNVDILVNVMTLGNSTNSSTGNGIFNFDTGIVDISGLIIGTASSGTGIGNFTIGGGTLNVGATGFLLGNSGGGTATGTFNVNGGIANINSAIFGQKTGSGGSSNGTINIGGGTLNMNGNSIGNGAGTPVTTVNATTGTLENVGTINVTGGLTKTGAGTLLITTTGGFTSNAYTGNTTISAGVVQLGTTGAVQNSTLVINVNAGLAFSSGVGSFTAGGLAGTGNFALTDTTPAPVALNITNNAGASSTYSGNISGAGSLSLSGNSTLTLSGINTYTGGTSINGNNVIVTGSLASSGNVTVTTGILSGITSGPNTLGNVTLNGGTISPGTAVTPIGNLNMTALTVNGGTLNFNLGPSNTNSAIAVSGLANFTQASSVTVTSAVAPGTYALLTAGTLSLGVDPTLTPPVGSSFGYALDFSQPNEILLDVAGSVVHLTWASTSDPNWDTMTNNWNNGTGLTNYADPDTVTFDDTPGVQTNISLNITVNPGSVTVNSNNNNFNISGSGAIAGATTALTKSGNSTLTLLTANTYGGGTIINGGTIQVNSGASLGAATGTLTINAGTLEILGGNTISTTRNIALGATTSSILVDGGSSYTVSGTIVNGTSNGTLNATGSGTLALTGNNTYSGGTNISGGGIVQINTDASLGLANTTVSINAGTLEATTTLSTPRPIKISSANSILQVDTGFTLTATGVVSDGASAGTLNKTGAGAITLSNTLNSYSGGTVFTAGTVNINADSELGALPGTVAPANLSFSGGTLNATANMTLNPNRGITISGNGTLSASANVTLTYNGTITDNGGSGNFNFSGSGLIIFGGTATYGGTTAINGSAILQLAHGTTLPTNTILNTNATSEIMLGDANGPANISISNLGSGGATANPGVIAGPVGQSVVTINYTGGTVATYSRFIGGSGANQNNIALVFGGTGPFKLNGNPNTYTGGTTVNSGTLISGQVGALGDPTSPITMSGGILDLETATSVNAYNVALTGNATIAPDTSATSVAAFTQQLGTLSIPAVTLTVANGLVLTTGTPTLAFGATTLTTTSGVTTFNPSTTNAVNPAVKLSTVTGSATVGNTDTLDLDGTTPVNQITGNIIDGSAGGNVALLKSNSSTWTLSGANTYTGGTIIAAGTLKIGSATALPANTALTFGSPAGTSGTLDLGGIGATVIGLSINAGSTANTQTITNSGSSAAALTFSTGISNFAGVIQDGTSPTNLLVTSNGNLTLTSPQNYTGTTTINAGSSLALSSNGSLNPATNITTNGSLSFAAPSQTIASLSGTTVAASVNLNTTALTINATSSYAGSINDNATNGSLIIPSGVTFTNGSVNVTNLSVNGNEVFTNTTIRTLSKIGSTTFAGNLTVAGSYGGSATAVSAYTGGIDLTTSRLIVEDSSGNRTNDLAYLKNLALPSNTTGNVGIYSSTAAAANALAGRTDQVVAVVDNGVRMATFPSGSTNFGSGTNNVDANSILLTATYLGDANLDGQVNILDLQDLANHWQQSVTDWSQADFNGDGIVNILDLQALANHWQFGVGQGNGSGESFSDATSLAFDTTAATPEPASLALFGLGGVALASRRRRK